MHNNKRSRLISFRVSPDEYAAMKAKAFDAGARSLSAFARDAAIDAMNKPAVEPTINLSGGIAALANRLAGLRGSLQQAAGEISSVLGAQ
jgi:hypothetical protein